VRRREWRRKGYTWVEVGGVVSDHPAQVIQAKDSQRDV